MKVSAKLLILLEGTLSSSVEKRRFIAAIQVIVTSSIIKGTGRGFNFRVTENRRQLE